MPVTQETLEGELKKAFPAAQITITDLAGDNDHWSTTIIDSGFAGKTRIAQHKMVQSATKHLNIHALQIKTSS